MVRAQLRSCLTEIVRKRRTVQFGTDDATVWLHAGFPDEAACQAISYAIKKGGRVKERL